MLISEIKNEIVAKHEILQQDLLSPSKFIKYCHDRGLSTISSKYVTELWQQGLLHADIIYSDKSIDIDGLILVEEDAAGGRFVYADNRPVPIKKAGQGALLMNRHTSNILSYSSIHLDSMSCTILKEPLPTV